MVPIRYFLIFVLMILLSSGVCAVGITGGPLRLKQVFEPNSEYNFYYTFIAGKTQTNNYEVYATRDMAEYVYFPVTKFADIAAEERVGFNGVMKLPATIDPPGWHQARICVREDCLGSGQVCGRAGACAVLEFLVLYEGIEPILSFNVPNANENEVIDLNVHIQNYGKEDIQSCSGKVEIFNLEKDSLGYVSLSSAMVKSSETAVLTGTYATQGIKPGNYSAEATIDCDGVIKKANSSFRIGNLDVRILDHTKELEIGGIKRLGIKVESAWNDPLNINADIVISEDGKTKVEHTTSTKQLGPWQTLELEAFIDTANLEPKDYDIKITAHYSGRSTTKEGFITMIEGKEKAPSEVKEAEVESAGISATMLTVILVVVVILLTLVNVFLAVYRKKKE